MPALRHLVSACLAFGLLLWLAAILAPPPGDAELARAQRVLRLFALASSAEGLAVMPLAPAWLGPPVLADAASP